MNPDALTARRANIDDLPALKALWAGAGLDVLEAERHLTEFQLCFDGNQALAACAAMRVAGKSALLHSEAFVHPEAEDLARAALWPRFQALARNHGLAKIWTLEEAPFWHQNGFTAADEAGMKKFPPQFGDPHARWHCLTLKEENIEVISLEKEFELFQQAQKESTDRMLKQAKFLKQLAILVLGVGVIVLGIFMFRVFTRSPAIRSFVRPK